MLLSETEYRFQVEDDIRPFRDILLGFFFITVGMKLDIGALFEGWQLVLMLLAILLLLKGLIVFALGTLYAPQRGRQPESINVSGAGRRIRLCNFGGVAHGLNLLSGELEQAATAAILISMILAPFTLRRQRARGGTAGEIELDMKAVDMQNMLIATMNKSEHILIVGYGRGGQTIGRIMRAGKYSLLRARYGCRAGADCPQRRRAGVVWRCQAARSA